MRTFLITTLLLLLYGCSTTGSIQVKTDLSDIKAAAPMLTETSTDTVAYDGNLLLIHSPYCDSLDSKRRTWSAITAVAGALAGSSAIIASASIIFSISIGKCRKYTSNLGLVTQEIFNSTHLIFLSLSTIFIDTSFKYNIYWIATYIIINHFILV